MVSLLLYALRHAVMYHPPVLTQPGLVWYLVYLHPRNT